MSSALIGAPPLSVNSETIWMGSQTGKYVLYSVYIAVPSYCQGIQNGRFVSPPPPPPPPPPPIFLLRELDSTKVQTLGAISESINETRHSLHRSLAILFDGTRAHAVYTCQQSQLLDLERRRFSKIACYFSSACCTGAIGIALMPLRCL